MIRHIFAEDLYGFDAAVVVYIHIGVGFGVARSDN
jgi:hypothetical protein